MYRGLNAQGTRWGRTGAQSAAVVGTDRTERRAQRRQGRSAQSAAVVRTGGPSMTVHMLGGEWPPTRAVWWALLALYLFAALAEAVGRTRCVGPVLSAHLRIADDVS